jgi:hypothetical protein
MAIQLQTFHVLKPCRVAYIMHRTQGVKHGLQVSVLDSMMRFL